MQKKKLSGEDLFRELLQQLGDDEPVEFQLPDWLKQRKLTPYTAIRRNVYLTKKMKTRVPDEGIFCSCVPSLAMPAVCGKDCKFCLDLIYWFTWFEAATLVIKDTVEPLLDDYKPSGISSLKFSKISLGNVPPKIKEPKPRIDYTLKAVGGSLTAIPGLSDMIDDTVTSIITDMLEWPHRIIVPLGGVDVNISELELKPQGKLTVKNQEFVGKSDPYVVLYVRPVFKVKTKVIDDNLNPVWNETFELFAEDKETQSIIFEVYDEDNLQQDKRMGIAKLSLQQLKPEVTKEIELNLLSSLDTLKIKDKKDRGSLTVKVLYHPFTKEEQLVALEEEKKALEERKKLKDEGVIGSTKAAIGRAASLVGSGVGMVDTGIGVGADLVQTGVGAGVGLVGSRLGAGADLVQTGVGTGVGLVGSGLGAGVGFVGSGLGAMSRAGKFMGKSMTNQFSTSSKKTSNNPAKGDASAN